MRDAAAAASSSVIDFCHACYICIVLLFCSLKHDNYYHSCAMWFYLGGHDLRVAGFGTEMLSTLIISLHRSSRIFMLRIELKFNHQGLSRNYTKRKEGGGEVLQP